MLDNTLKALKSARKGEKKSILPDSESLLQTRGKYDELADLITNLQLKLNHLYNYNEKEFLGIYRVHTLDLQSEIKYLKDKVRVAEEILNDDTTISTLEREANWFKDEVDRLKADSESMNRDLLALMERSEVLNDQRIYLSDQYKLALRQIRMYELAKTTDSNDHRLKKNNSHDEESELLLSQIEHPDGNKDSPSYKSSPPPLLVSRKQSTFKVSKINKSQYQKSFIRNSSHNITHSYVDDVLLLRNNSSFLSNNHQPSSKQSKNGWQAYEKFMASKSDLEEGLEIAIKKTLDEEIIPRRESMSRPTSRNLNTRTKNISNLRGLTGLGFDGFTDTDKLSSMIRFLSNQQNFEQMIEILKLGGTDST